MTNHLLHIGYPKAGSTFLQRWFALHPQLGFADGGILGLRNVHQIAQEGALPPPARLWRVTSCENLSTAVFPNHVWQEHLASGSLESIGELKRLAENRVRHTLAELFPDATILIVTRGFRSFLLSAYSQFVREGGTADVATATRALRDTPTAANVSCNYDELIRSYAEAFAGRVIVMPYELLREDPVVFVRTLESTLGLQHCPPPEGRLNPSLSAEELRWYPRMGRAMWRLPIGRRLRGTLHARYVRVINSGKLTGLVAGLQRLRPKAPVTADSFGDELVEKFRGCVDSLRHNPLFTPYAAEYLF